MSNITDSEVNLLRYNARNVVRELGLLNDVYFDIGVTLAERHLLIELSNCLYPTVSEIAERLLLDKSTASRLVAKTVKKGYVKYSSDESDKRKRFLQFTEKGKEILNKFESIAFNQTKNALLTLTNKEIEAVYHGIELYAKGLKISRLRSGVEFTQIKQQDNAKLARLFTEIHKIKHFFLLNAQKKDSTWMNLFEFHQKKGSAYFVMKIDSKIVGGGGIAPFHSDKTRSCELKKICLHPETLGLGFEHLLIDFCVQKAKKMGYTKCYVDISNEFLVSCDFFEQYGFQFVNNDKENALLWKAC